jgi:branched-chain amino acid transport system substrate-binding protein
LAKSAVAQQRPVKIGLMTVKTGGLAAGGVHLEEGITCFLKDKNFTLAGRKIELLVADTAGVPATAKSKAIELVERSPPLNGSRSRTISASIRFRPWASAAPRI